MCNVFRYSCMLGLAAIIAVVVAVPARPETAKLNRDSHELMRGVKNSAYVSDHKIVPIPIMGIRG